MAAGNGKAICTAVDMDHTTGNKRTGPATDYPRGKFLRATTSTTYAAIGRA